MTAAVVVNDVSRSCAAATAGVESPVDGCGATRRMIVAAAGRGFNDAISS